MATRPLRLTKAYPTSPRSYRRRSRPCQESIRDMKEARAAEVLEARALLPTTPTDSKLEQQPSFNQAASKARAFSLQAISFLGRGGPE